MDNNNNANLLNITYEKYPKLCENNMTRNVNNNTVGTRTNQQLKYKLKVKVKKGNLSKDNFGRSQ